MSDIPAFLRRAAPPAADPSPLMRLWLLRILVPLGAQREFVKQHGFKSDTLAYALGMHNWVEDPALDFDPRAVRRELRELHAQAERRLARSRVSRALRTNISRLSRLVGLSQADCRILEFAVLIHNERLLDDTADWLGLLSSIKVFHALATILDLPAAEVRAALSADGILTRSGLVTVDRSGAAYLRGKLSLLSDNFADHILSSESDPITLLKDTVSPGAPARLALADYDHVSASLAIMRPYLKRALKEGRRGVNIFVHGHPGTGKSELARVLAQELGCPLFEVASEDSDGDPVNGERRLRAFRAAQSFLTKRAALILFDEVEDVFNDGDHGYNRKSTAQSRKAWINRMLEENPVPTLWLSNSVRCLDPAFIRRFDMVMELPVPPRRQREAIVRAACGDMLDGEFARRIAGSDVLAPAVIARAASVVRCIRDDLDDTDVPRAVAHLVSSTLEAQGYGRLQLEDAAALPDTYDPDFIRADADLAAVAAGLSRTRSGRLCLYGPPGTGKTAFGRWLADRMEVPLRIERASDLLSMYVGGTEQNIARAFKEARQDGALLMIDEVDSFLQDRRGAQRFWEVTAVNEMLTQMESFPGVFVASTNLMAGLDQAALRRFDIKVKFDFLEAEQAWRLLERQCAALSLKAPPEGLRAGLARLRMLTPGDFALVARQHRFRPVRDADALVEALARECAAKEGGRGNPIGFV
jgi:SpoVK/Ycf46/Vps4 family AAA+-type ATPase